MKTQIIDTERRDGLADEFYHTTASTFDDWAKKTSCEIANSIARQFQGEEYIRIDAEQCFLQYDLCSACGHHQECMLRRFRIAILQAIDMTKERTCNVEKEGGEE